MVIQEPERLQVQVELTVFRGSVKRLRDDWNEREKKLMWEAKSARDINYWVLQGQIKEIGRVMLDLEELLK